MKKRDTNSIRDPKETDDIIEKLAKTLNRSKKELLCQMADYFTEVKKIQQTPVIKCWKQELPSGISRIVSFIRQHEKDFLLPLFTNAGNLKTVFSTQMEILRAIDRNLLAKK